MVKPVLDNILIKPFESDNVSEGGILVPNSFLTRNNKATVVAVGNGTKAKPMQFKPGDIVYNIKDAGDEIIIEGEKHYLIKDSYVLALN